MGNGSLSGFFLDVEDLFASITFRRMSFAEKGVYLVMLCEEWRQQERTLPDNPAAVADLIAISEAQTAEVTAAWEVVRRKFVADQRKPGRIFNVRLEQTRRQQAKSRLQRAAAGRAGGNRKAANLRRIDDLSPSNAIAPLDENLAKPSVVLGVVGSSSAVSGLVGRSKTPPTGNARSGKLIYQSDRFVVFEWQWAELDGMLGAHSDAFDLHGFFDELTQRSRSSGLVIPRNGKGSEFWGWMQQQVLGEAKRRGLPLAEVVTQPALGKQSTKLLAAVSQLSQTR